MKQKKKDLLDNTLFFAENIIREIIECEQIVGCHLIILMTRRLIIPTANQPIKVRQSAFENSASWFFER